MKTLLCVCALAGLLTPEFISAQGVTYVSNLGEPSTGSQAVGSDSWFAVSFRTGANANGYQLNSVQLFMDQASGNPNGFTIALYNGNGSFPGDSFGNLIGFEPLTPGIFTFSNPGIVLPPSTSYFIVATAAAPVAQGSYQWRTASGAGEFYGNGWIRGAAHYYSPNGSSWTVNRESSFQFAINATAVPEPSSLVLLCFSSLILGIHLFRRAKARA